RWLEPASAMGLVRGRALVEQGAIEAVGRAPDVERNGGLVGERRSPQSDERAKGVLGRWLGGSAFLRAVLGGTALGRRRLQALAGAQVDVAAELAVVIEKLEGLVADDVAATGDGHGQPLRLLDVEHGERVGVRARPAVAAHRE